jgi:hypothetical protein
MYMLCRPSWLAVCSSQILLLNALVIIMQSQQKQVLVTRMITTHVYVCVCVCVIPPPPKTSVVVALAPL